MTKHKKPSQSRIDAKNRLSIRKVLWHKDKLQEQGFNNKSEKKAKNAKYVDKGDNLGVKTYNKSFLENAAANAGYMDEDNKPDVTAHGRSIRKRAAKIARYLNEDDKPDVDEYSSTVSAKNQQF